MVQFGILVSSIHYKKFVFNSFNVFTRKILQKFKNIYFTKMFNFYLKESYQYYFEVGPSYLARNVTETLQALRGLSFSLK